MNGRGVSGGGREKKRKENDAESQQREPSCRETGR